VIYYSSLYLPPQLHYTARAFFPDQYVRAQLQ